MPPAAPAPISLHPLEAEDEAPVRAWIDTFLRQHCAWWSAAITGEPWPPEIIRRHMEARDAVGREWRELWHARDHQDAFVRVARDPGARGRRLGVVYAEVKKDRYLGSPLGVLSFIYRDPGGERRGVADLLMQAATEWMAWRGVVAREVFVTSHNRPAIALYERHGFRIADHRMLGR